MKTALIMGATGMTGKILTGLLLGSPIYENVYVLHYRPTPFSENEHIIDMDDIETGLKIEGPVDDVFCTIGSTRKRAGSAEAFRKVDLDYVLALGRWARTKDIKRFSVISSDCAGAGSMFLYLKTKGEMEDGLRALEFPCLNIYRPPMLHAESRPEHRFGEKAGYCIMNALSVLPGLGKQKPLDVSKLAQVMFSEAQTDCSGVRVFGSMRLLRHEV